MMRLWVLGASDPEMVEIERVLRAAGESAAQAVRGNRAVHPGNAYTADGIQGSLQEPADCACIFVECAVSGIEPETIVDHHRPGDPGYGCAPEEFLKASSLGQVLAMLGIEATPEQRLIAAADHCLAHAYRGECPGVDPDELMTWRIGSRARFQNRPETDVLADIDRARRALRTAHNGLICPDCAGSGQIMGRPGDCDTCGGSGWWLTPEEIPFFRETIPELPEAAAREGIPFVAKLLERGREKLVLQCAKPDTVSRWLDQQRGMGRETYGDPARGFAGCYL